MDQEIIETPYNDNHLSTQVVTIVLPSVPHNSDIQPLYSQDTHTMTPLQPNETTNQLIAGASMVSTRQTNDANIASSNDTNNVNDTVPSMIDDKNLAKLNLASSESTENHTSIDPTALQKRGSKSRTRFKWTKESAQVALNLVKHGCKPVLVSVAVGCSLRTAQKFVEIVKPKMEGESFKDYEIRRRGRKSRDVNQRLEAIREVLSKDSSKTQVQIAADLKVSNTTVCRDLKRIGASWRKNDSDPLSPSKRDTSKKDRPLSSSGFKGKSGARQKRGASKKQENKLSSDCN